MAFPNYIAWLSLLKFRAILFFKIWNNMTAGSNMIFLQVTFILYDLVANVAIDSLARTGKLNRIILFVNRKSGYVQLVVLVFQLILLALSLLIFFLSVFYTYPVQVNSYLILQYRQNTDDIDNIIVENLKLIFQSWNWIDV